MRFCKPPFFFCLILFISCATKPTPPAVVNEELQTDAEANFETTLWDKAVNIAALLNDSELAGQVIMTAIDGTIAPTAGSRSRLKTVKPGAVLLFKANLNTDKDGVKNLTAAIRDAAALVKDGAVLPPIIAVDHEGGLVHRFGAGVEKLPAPLSYHSVFLTQGKDAALAKIYDDAQRSAREIADLGFTMNLAPVVEILDDTNKKFLDTRAYGYEPDFVVDAAQAFINGMRSGGILCVIKHFPGNSSLDPHKTLPVLALDEDALRSYTKPFLQVIEKAQPSGLMASHIIVEQWDNERPASLSSIVIQQKIRKELGFQGIIFTDDLAMGAVASIKIEEASVLALAAGADMVITWPGTVLDVHAAIIAALKTNRLPRERLLEAAAHIIVEKLRQ